MAWQFDRPERGAGVVQAFRRAECSDDNCRLKLYGLDASAQYTVTDFDQEQPVQMTGRDLMDAGLPVRSPKCPGAIVLVYTKE